MRRIAAPLILFLLFAPIVVADTIILDNGDTLTGKIIETKPEGTVLESSIFGQVLIPHGRITSITPDPKDDPEQVEKVEAAEQAVETAKADGTADPAAMATVIDPPEIKEVRPGLFGTSFMRGWEKSIGAGINGTTGNSEAINFNASLSFFFEDERDRWDIQAAYYFAKSSGGKTQDQAFASIRKDWLFADSPWFVFAQGRYDYDAFKNYDHRLSAGLGIGYEFIKTDTFFLAGRVGLGLSQEFGGTNDDLVLEALLGLETKWDITENQNVAAGITVYPALTDLGEFRAIAYLDYIVAIDRASGLNLKFGLQNEYISNSGTAKNNDFLYYGQLILDF